MNQGVFIIFCGEYNYNLLQILIFFPYYRLIYMSNYAEFCRMGYWEQIKKNYTLNGLIHLLPDILKREKAER